MTSKTSSKNNLLPQLKSTFSRNKVRTALTMLIPLVLLIFTLLDQDFSYYTEYKTEYDASLELSMYLLPKVLIPLTIMLFIRAIHLFKETFKRRSADFYFSVPVSRKVYYTANLIYGIICIAGTYIVSIITAIIGMNALESKDKYLTANPTEFIKVLGVLMICEIALYSIFLMSSVLSGRKWHAIVFSVIFAGIAPMAIYSASSYLNSIWGFYQTGYKLFVLSPLSAIYFAMNSNVSLVATSVIMIAIIIVTYFVSVYTFNRRKADIAETSIAHSPLAMAGIVIFQVFAFMFPILIIQLTDYEGTPLKKIYLQFIAVAILVEVVATVIITLMLYKKVFVKETMVSMLAVSVLAIAFTAVATYGTSSFSNYVPNSEDVASVEVSTANNSYSDLYISSLIYGGMSYLDEYDTDADKASYNFKEKESIEKAVSLQEAVVKTGKELQYNTATDYYDDDYCLTISFKLNSGKVVKRHYYLSNNLYKDGTSMALANLLKTEEGINQVTVFDNYDVAFVSYYDEDDEQQFITDYVDFEKAYKEDLKT